MKKLTKKERKQSRQKDRLATKLQHVVSEGINNTFFMHYDKLKKPSRFGQNIMDRMVATKHELKTVHASLEADLDDPAGRKWWFWLADLHLVDGEIQYVQECGKIAQACADEMILINNKLMEELRNDHSEETRIGWIWTATPTEIIDLEATANNFIAAYLTNHYPEHA